VIYLHGILREETKMVERRGAGAAKSVDTVCHDCWVGREGVEKEMHGRVVKM
jgi:hypothetical protein